MVHAVRLDSLTKRFGSLTAVDRLSLEVAGGSVVGFLGPNGAGKTTTIRLLLDLLRPTSGSIEVLGRPPADPLSRVPVGHLPAELAIDPRWTMRDLLELSAGVRAGTSHPVDRAEADRLIERFDVQVDRRFGELSTGNRRKVGIVAAFAHRPDLLVLDEPTTGLDPLLQVEFHRLVEERVDAGATVFLSSHVLPEVERIAGRVVVIRDGRLVAELTPEDIASRAREHLVLEFPEPPPAAALDGVPGVVAVRGEGRALVVTIGGSVAPVLARAAELGVRRLDVRHLELEDVFLDLYRSTPEERVVDAGAEVPT